MLTAEKVKIFKRYRGYLDGYLMQNRDKEQIVSSYEWTLLSGLMQDLFLVSTEKVSISYTDSIMQKLKDACDNNETVHLVLELERYFND